MARLTFLERQQLEKLFDMYGGYVLDFSNRTFAEFVADSVGKDIYDERYDYASGSKANRLRAFWTEESDEIVGTLINELIKYAEFTNKTSDPQLIAACRIIVERLLTSAAATEQRLNTSSNDRDPGSPKEERAAVRVFISYSWDSKSHKDWVRNFANKLSANGIDVILDQYDLPLGRDRFEFMERSVRDADVVLCVCTATYVAKANNRDRGVGIETALITPQFFDRVKNQKQFIPVIRESSPGTPTTPDYMAALLSVDFRVDGDFLERMEELLRHLHRRPKYKKPRVGAAPYFEQTDADDVEFSADDEIEGQGDSATLSPPPVKRPVEESELPHDILELIQSAEASESIGDVWSASDTYAKIVTRSEELGLKHTAQEMERRMRKNISVAASIMRGD